MTARKLDLTPRREAVREPNPVVVPVHFSLDEIKVHFDESMTAVQNQFQIADTLEAAGFVEDAETIWRSQVVLFAGVLDFYLHEMAKYGFFQIFSGVWAPTPQYSKLSIPITTVQAALDAKDTEWFFDFVNQHYSHVVFMAADKIKDILNTIGVTYAEVMCCVFPQKNKTEAVKAGDDLLKEQFARRNAIAHQLDRCHASAVQTPIDKQYVQRYAQNITAIVTAIHDIAKNKKQ